MGYRPEQTGLVRMVRRETGRAPHLPGQLRGAERRAEGEAEIMSTRDRGPAQVFQLQTRHVASAFRNVLSMAGAAKESGQGPGAGAQAGGRRL